MSIISIAVTFIIMGVVLWLFNKYTPMSNNVRAVFNLVVVVFWILCSVGVLGRGGEVRISE